MSHVRRTLTRSACYVGVAGSLLASHAAIAQSYPPYHSSDSRARIAAVYGVKTSQQSGTAVVQVSANVRHSGLPGGLTRYTTTGAYIPASKLRVAGLAALGRGFMHPGLQLAIAAAGFAWSLQDGIQVPGETPYDVPDNYASDAPAVGQFGDYSGCSYVAESGGTKSSEPIQQFLGTFNTSGGTFEVLGVTNGVDTSACTGGVRVNYRFYPSSGGFFNGTEWYYASTSAPDVVYDWESGFTPATETDLEQLDQHIPAELVDNLWSDSSWSENVAAWAWEGSSLDTSLEKVESYKPTTSEVMGQAQKQNQTLYEQLAGQEITHKDDPPPVPRTPEEELAEREIEDREEPIPPFEEPDINWQTEVLDLPSYSSGIGGGGCPGGQSVTVLGQSINIDYQPACDLATSVKPAVVGVAGVIALLIVVRARGGS